MQRAPTIPCLSSSSAAWHFVPPSQRDRLAAERAAGREVAELLRHGVDHGAVVLGDGAVAAPDDPLEGWARAEPILLPAAVDDALRDRLDDALATWHAFADFRRGVRLLDELDRRLGDDEQFEYSGSTVDHHDAREIETVFVDVPGPRSPTGRRIRDLSFQLRWLHADDADESLQVRCSFGHAATRDWLAEDVRALWSDRLTGRAFAETRCVTDDQALRAFVDRAVGGRTRLSECRLQSLAAGGGAGFDGLRDPGPRGLVYAQMLGATVLLAGPQRELAESAAAFASGDRLREPDAVLRAMQGGPDAERDALLNATPALTAALAEAGRLFVVGSGDVLLLPSPGGENCCWWSSFGVGTQPGLATTFTLFDALPDLPNAPG